MCKSLSAVDRRAKDRKNKLEGDNKTVTEIQLILVVSNLRTSIQKFKKTDKKLKKLVRGIESL